MTLCGIFSIVHWSLKLKIKLILSLIVPIFQHIKYRIQGSIVPIHFEVRLPRLAIIIILFFNYLNASMSDTCGYTPKKSTISRYITFDSGDKKPRFADRVVKWYYNSVDYKGFSEYNKQNIIRIIKKAMSSWSKYGDIKFEYQGESTSPTTNTNDEIITIAYLNKNDFNNACGRRYLGCASSSWDFDKVIYDGFIALNPRYYHRLRDIELQGLITHEIGHLLGLDHSDDRNSIMYSKPYHSNTYQATLRADDIKAISSLYPYPTKWITGAYLNDTNESKVLSINDANSLKVKVKGKTEANYDFISFFDEKGHNIKKFSGLIDEEFIINESYIKALLTSDKSIVKSGVEISISSF